MGNCLSANERTALTGNQQQQRAGQPAAKPQELAQPTTPSASQPATARAPSFRKQSAENQPALGPQEGSAWLDAAVAHAQDLFVVLKEDGATEGNEDLLDAGWAPSLRTRAQEPSPLPPELRGFMDQLQRIIGPDNAAAALEAVADDVPWWVEQQEHAPRPNTTF